MEEDQSLLAGAIGLSDFLERQESLPAMKPLMERLWPICRSITGPGVRKTLDIIGELIPLEHHVTPSGRKVFDWIVPPEWRIEDAFIATEDGQKIIDFKNSNLHVVQYSEPVSVELTLEELQPRLHSIPEQPDAIPYVTSYYKQTWGFCLTHEQRLQLRPGRYRCVIKSELDSAGQLDVAQTSKRGMKPDEIFFSTYICHPSMANNELSGPTVQTYLFQILGAISGLRLSYRAAFTTETIGTLCYLKQFGGELKQRVIGGSVLTCLGGDGPFTYVRSRRHPTTNDRVVEHVLRHVFQKKNIAVHDWRPVGSDERQYCSPGINLPIGALSRSAMGDYTEYHTSLDNLTFVTEAELQKSLRYLLRLCQAFELNVYPVRTNPYGEPQLGRRGLYSSDRTSVSPSTREMLYVLGYADGQHSMLDIAEKADCPIWLLLDVLNQLVDADLVRLKSEPLAPTTTPWQDL